MTYQLASVGEVCDLKNGRAFKPEDWSLDGQPIIRIQNLNGKDKPFNYWAGPIDRQIMVQKGDVLLAWSGTPGTSFGAHIWDGPNGVLNQHIFRVDLDETRVTKKWWTAAVNASLNKLIAQAHGGVGLKHVTKRMVNELEIPIPPIEEQSRITAILDEAEALRLLRKRAIDRLEDLSHSAFNEMFGEDLKEAHGDPALRLSDVVDGKRGISYGIVQRGKQVDDGVPVVRISNLSNDRFDPTGIVKTSPEISAGYKRTELNGGELAVSIRGSVGKVAVIPENCRGWNVSREVAVIPIKDLTQGSYFWSLIRNSLSQSFILGEVRGVAQSGINLSDLRKLPVPENYVEQSQRWTPIAAKLDLIRDETIEKFIRIDNLFLSLQKNAFRGEL